MIPILFALKKNTHLQIETSFATTSAKRLVQLFYPTNDGIITSDLESRRKRLGQLLKWRKKRFDYVVSGGHLNSDKTALIAYFVRARRSIGLVGEKYSFLYDVLLPKPSSNRRYLRYEALFRYFGLTSLDFEYGENAFRQELERIAQTYKCTGLRNEENDFRIAFANGADLRVRGHWKPFLKRVPEHILGAIADKLKCNRRTKFVLLGGVEDKLSDTFASNEDFQDMRGRTSIADIVSILNHIDLLICNDTGLMHLAHFCGTPYIALFGPTAKEQFAPTENDTNAIQAPGNCSRCYPTPQCADSYCTLFESIDVKKIVDRASNILRNKDNGFIYGDIHRVSGISETDNRR